MTVTDSSSSLAYRVDPAVVERQVAARLLSPDFDRWAEQAAAAGHCTSPIRLTGSATTLDKNTGEVLSTYSTTGEPDGVLYVRCGNRRASVCPSCSHEYKGDTWHLLAAGAAGGMKGVPESVAAHPMVFATVTAPSFGPVHTTRTGQGGLGRCHPRRRVACQHGRPVGCNAVHADGDSRLGQPLCRDCYRYTEHVVWQWHAPELWRRFTITLRRRLAARLGMTQTHLGQLARLSFAKVAEFQRRGVIHFHALIRLDGPASAVTGEHPFPAPLVDVPAEVLADVIRETAALVAYDAPPASDGEPCLRLRFGKQVDARPVTSTASRDDGQKQPGDLHPETVAAYIAKYATKACEEFGLPQRLRSPEAAARLGVNAHICRLLATVLDVASTGGEHYAGLVRWAAMLGFRGHFSTKSRRYSTTLGRLRTARKRWQLQRLRGESCDESTTGWQDDDPAEDSTLVLSDWALAGIGWLTAGDAALAATGSDGVRDWRDAKVRTRSHPSTSARTYST